MQDTTVPTKRRTFRIFLYSVHRLAGIYGCELQREQKAISTQVSVKGARVGSMMQCKHHTQYISFIHSYINFVISSVVAVMV